MTTRTLHHFPFDPASRQARLALGEKKLAFAESVVRYWEQPEEFRRLNLSGIPPVLVEGPLVVCELPAVLGHVEEQHDGVSLIPVTAIERAEMRRLQQWFDRKFMFEVDGPILFERMEKRLQGLGAPEAGPLRQGREALRWHLGYIETLASGRNWLAGDTLSFADLAAAAHLSVLDYFGEAPWAQFPAAKTWYMRIKSRPSFRPLLSDRLPGVAPVGHYCDLDF